MGMTPQKRHIVTFLQRFDR